MALLSRKANYFTLFFVILILVLNPYAVVGFWLIFVATSYFNVIG